MVCVILYYSKCIYLCVCVLSYMNCSNDSNKNSLNNHTTADNYIKCRVQKVISTVVEMTLSNATTKKKCDHDIRYVEFFFLLL